MKVRLKYHEGEASSQAVELNPAHSKQIPESDPVLVSYEAFFTPQRKRRLK
jgi:hypothetical protein